MKLRILKKSIQDDQMMDIVFDQEYPCFEDKNYEQFFRIILSQKDIIKQVDIIYY